MEDSLYILSRGLACLVLDKIPVTRSTLFLSGKQNDLRDYDNIFSPQNVPVITCVWIGFFLTSFVIFIGEFLTEILINHS